MIVKMILDRAPPADVVGGHAALRIAIDELLDAWEALANDEAANAERLSTAIRVKRLFCTTRSIRCSPPSIRTIGASPPVDRCATSSTQQS